MKSRTRALLTIAAVLLSLSARGLWAEEPETPASRPVLAIGVGETPEKALEDALRNAVEQAVGVLIDAKTIVENEQILQDKVLRMSNALVERYEVLKRWTASGLHHCKVSAQVRSRELRKQLAAEPAFRGKIEGENLGAQVRTELSAKGSTADILRGFFDDLWGKTLYARVTGKPQPSTEVKSDRVLLEVPVEVGVDPEAWDSVVETWLPKLRAAARARSTGSLQYGPGGSLELYRGRPVSGDWNFYLCQEDLCLDGLSFPPVRRLVREDRGGNASLVVAEAFEVEGAGQAAPETRTRVLSIGAFPTPSGLVSVESLAFDEDVLRPFMAEQATALRVDTNLVDGKGKAVSKVSASFPSPPKKFITPFLSQEVDVELHGSHLGKWANSKRSWTVVMPGRWILQFSSSALVSSWSGVISVPVAASDLAKLDRIDLSVTPVGVPVRRRN